MLYCIPLGISYIYDNTQDCCDLTQVFQDFNFYFSSLKCPLNTTILAHYGFYYMSQNCKAMNFFKLAMHFNTTIALLFCVLKNII